MGHYDNSLTILVPEVEEKPVQFFLGLCVKIAGRLVREKDGRLIYQGTGYSHPLLLTSGQLRRLVRQTLCKAQFGQQSLRRRLRLLFRTTGNESRNHDILDSSEFRQQMMELENEPQLPVPEIGQSLASELEHIYAVYHKRACIGSGKRTQNLQQSRLTGSGRTHYGYDLRLFRIEINPLQNLERTEGLLYSFCLYHNLLSLLQR